MSWSRMLSNWWRRVALEPGLDIVEYPKIARLLVAPITCRLCGGVLGNGDVVLWFERKGGWRSDLAHAACAVFVRKLDGAIVRPGGVPVADAEKKMGPGTLLLTEQEWGEWYQTV